MFIFSIFVCKHTIFAKKNEKNPSINQLFLEKTLEHLNFAFKMLRWVNTTSARMQMGDKLLSPICFLQRPTFRYTLKLMKCSLFILSMVFLGACEEDKNSKNLLLTTAHSKRLKI